MPKSVIIDNVSIVFGDHPRKALPLMDAQKNRDEIQIETGQVLGVHNCSLEVQEGEIVVLMGLSGSGKSTLLRAINGLNPAIRGNVLVNDGQGMVNISTANAQAMRRIRQKHVAMVFQQFGLLPWRTVRENVELGLEFSGLPRAKRREMAEHQLKRVSLIERADSNIDELSGGMQQRVGLARAFATRAPILLMDEPFSALDPLIRSKLQDELLALQKEDKHTIIFVSHDLDEAFKIGNRIAIMEGGRIVQCGTPKEIFSNPANEYVAEFVAHMNPLGVLRARDVMVPATTPCVSLVDADDTVQAVIRQLMKKGGTVGVQENGQVIGEITNVTILAKLVDPVG